MKIIANYLGTSLLKGILLVLLLLLSVDLFFYFINELKLIGIGNYDYAAAIEFIASVIPRKIYNMAPWAALLGSLLVLGTMAQYGELLCIRMIGNSINDLARSAGWYVIYFTVAVFLLGELIAPKLELFAQKRKMLALSEGNAIYTENGTWLRSQNKFIHVAKVRDQNTLEQVTIYELDPNFKLLKASFAETATLLNKYNFVESFLGQYGGDKRAAKPKDPIWTLHNVVINDFATQQLQASGQEDLAKGVDPALQPIKVFKNATITEQNLLDLNILRTAHVKHLERLSLHSIQKIIKNRLKNNLTVIDYKIAFWKKIVQPFSILIMSYLALPFVLGPLRAATKSTRTVCGVILGASFYLLNALFAPLVAVLNCPASVAVVLPPVIFLGITGYLIRKNYS